MKKNFAIVSAIAALFAMPAMSMGAAEVWFTLDSGNVSEVSSGTGQALQIERLNTPGVYDFTITMWANVTDTGIYGNITTLTSDGPATATAVNPTAAPGGVPTPPSSTGTGPGPIASNFGGATFSGAGFLGAGINMGTITLQIDDSDGSVGDVNIFAVIGDTLWGDANFSAPMVSFGPNGPVSGATAGAPMNGLPSISIVEVVPEPATLSLLGLGALALIRRRR